MTWRIVLSCKDAPAARALGRHIATCFEAQMSSVLQGGHLLEVRTEDAAEFISELLANGVTNTFTCQVEV